MRATSRVFGDFVAAVSPTSHREWPPHATPVSQTATSRQNLAGGSPTVTSASAEATAEHAWAILAPLIAARPRARESRGAQHRYERRWERPLTTRLPAVPAAVPLYSAAGDTRVLVIDLDTSRGGQAAVDRDTTAVTRLIKQAGGQVIVDESPSGGRHVYVPLAEPLGFHDARDLAIALATRTPSMDPTPNQNLSDGLIRPPGARHHSGGHQTLHGTLASAQQLAERGNPADLIPRLQQLLSPELATLHRPAEPTADTEFNAPIVDRRHPRELAADYLAIATSGTWDTNRYSTPSEARQAVITAAAWAGLSLAQVATRIETGIWPGLAACYARYRPGTRRAALTRDWRNASALIDRWRSQPDRTEHVHRSPTSQPPPHGGAPSELKTQDQQTRRGSQNEYRWIRTWWNALLLSEHQRYPGRSGLTTRWLLRALGEAAMKTGSRYVAFGSRALSIATGVDHTTVAAHLRQLRDEPDPFIDLIENDRGLQGDLYTLRIPDDISHRAATVSWPAGHLHGLRPVFRELGHPSAIVYEALEQGRHQPQRSFDLVGRTGLSRRAVHDALLTLAAWNLARQTRGRWTVVDNTSLALLAEQFGCQDAVHALVQRHRQERAAYRQVLRIVDQYHTPVLHPLDPRHPPPPPEPPPDDGETVIDLLQRMLGAIPLPLSM